MATRRDKLTEAYKRFARIRAEDASYPRYMRFLGPQGQGFQDDPVDQAPLPAQVSGQPVPSQGFSQGQLSASGYMNPNAPGSPGKAVDVALASNQGSSTNPYTNVASQAAKGKKGKVRKGADKEIRRWQEKLKDSNLSAKARARIERRISFLGGQPITNGQPLTDEQKRAMAIQDLLGPGAEGAKYLSEELFPEGSLGRVDTGFEEYTDPATGEKRTRRVGETQEALDMARGIYDKYSNRSDEMKDVVERNKAMLAGYDNPELQAMREQAQLGIDTQYQTAMRQQAMNAARSGVRGASSQAQARNLDRARMQEQQNLEQGLFVRGAEEKRRALGDYSNLIGNLETNEYSRAAGSQKSYADQLANQRKDELDRSKFNLDQIGAENYGRMGAYFGGIAQGEARRARRDQNRLARAALRAGRR